NANVSVEVKPVAKALSFAQLTAQAYLDDEDEIVSARVSTRAVALDLDVVIADQGKVAEMALGVGGEVGQLQLNIDTAAEDLTVAIQQVLQTSLNGSLGVANASGDKVSGAFSAGAAFVGTGPFTYVFGDEIEKRGEDASNFLGLDATASYSSIVGGNTLFSGNLIGGRASNETLELENFSVQHGGQTYAISGEFTESGDILALDTVDPVSGVRIVVTTTGGVTSGVVTSGAAQL